MLIQTNQPRPSDALVARAGEGLAKHLVQRKVEGELPELARAQHFQENVVAKQNDKGVRGQEGLGQCIARADGTLFLKIIKKHAFEIAVDQKKFWLVTAPQLYPELGLKPKYNPKAGVSMAGVKRFKF